MEQTTLAGMQARLAAERQIVRAWLRGYGMPEEELSYIAQQHRLGGRLLGFAYNGSRGPSDRRAMISAAAQD